MISVRKLKANRNNPTKGKKAEARIKNRYKRDGYKIERAGWGSDFKVTKNGRSKFVEVKSGTSRLTEKQLKMKKKYGSRYKVERC